MVEKESEKCVKRGRKMVGKVVEIISEKKSIEEVGKKKLGVK